MKIVLPILAAISLVVAAAAGAYYYQQQRVDQLTSENQSLRADAESNPSDNDSQQSQDDQTSITAYKSEKGVTVTVTSPTSDQSVTSPLRITGSVPGSWSTEAQFAIRLVDARGNMLAEGPATLQDDWMTDQPVDFNALLTFDAPASQNGTLVLLKSNPSDLPKNDDAVVVPIRFSAN